MKFEKVHNKGQATLFRSKYLEALTKTHPAVIFGMYLPVIGYMLYYSYAGLHYSLLRIILTYLAALFSWTLFEYAAHRYIFHWVSGHPVAKRMVYTLHGNHHEYPRDRQRLFMPPVPSVIIASFLFAVFYLLSGKNALMFFPGFISGYLIYGSMHYAIHAWAPPFRWLKPLWRNHHLHHYKNDDLGFGVSSTLWDRVFRTMFSVAVLLLLAQSPASAHQLSDGSYKLVKQEKNIALYERWIAASGMESVREVKAVFTVKSDVRSVTQLLRSQEQGTNWNAHVKMYRVLLSSDSNQWTTYLKYKIPWPFGDQDCCLLYRFNPHTAGERHGEITFESTSSSLFPVTADVSRITGTRGRWLMEDTGGSMKITYTITTNRSKVPRWVSDPIVRNNLFSTMDDFRSILEKQR
ncbi:sterol desaturase family protein [Chitinophaga solisilvae]|uniref:sterol desaturase family protein n=1 Tax=Chitinophaga solisilvae TaxID=1233460 RepID=UPI00136D59E5|nr:sterol desaturase family protein [Chitinophaga solisilvae]